MRWLRVSVCLTMEAFAQAPTASEVRAVTEATPQPQRACPAGRATCFGVRFTLGHQAASAAPVVDAAWLDARVGAANELFAPVGIGFVTAEVGVARLPERVVTPKERDGLVARDPMRPYINVYVVAGLQDLAAPMPLFGVHWRIAPARTQRGIILAAYGGDRVLAHELGHYFGLPHSTYEVSIMNKTVRARGIAERRFADEELPILRREAARAVGRLRNLQAH